MRTMRGGRGLGDTIYLQSIARHLTANGDPICVASDYSDVFIPLGRRVRVIPFTRQGVNIVAHYVMRKSVAGTSQFTDMCQAAGIRRVIDLCIDWQVKDTELVDRLKAPGKPIVCLQMARSPMGRTDGFGHEILPNCDAIQKAINLLQGRATIVQVGAGKSLYNFRGIDADLSNGTNVSQLFDIASVAHGFIGYPSFIVPLAESFNRRALIFWSTAGLRSAQPFISSITPAKLLHKATGRAVMDNSPEGLIEHEVAAFLQP